MSPFNLDTFTHTITTTVQTYTACQLKQICNSVVVLKLLTNILMGTKTSTCVQLVLQLLFAGLILSNNTQTENNMQVNNLQDNRMKCQGIVCFIFQCVFHKRHGESSYTSEQIVLKNTSCTLVWILVIGSYLKLYCGYLRNNHNTSTQFHSTVVTWRETY